MYRSETSPLPRRGFSAVELMVAGTMVIAILAIIQTLSRSAAASSARTVAGDEARRAALIAFERIARDLQCAVVGNLQTDVHIEDNGHSLAFGISPAKISNWDIKRFTVTYSAVPNPAKTSELQLVRTQANLQQPLPITGLTDVNFQVNDQAATGSLRSAVSISFVIGSGAGARVESTEFPLTVVAPPSPYLWIGMVAQ